MAVGNATHGKRPLVLLAARPVAREPFRAALGSDADIVEVDTLEQAVEHLKREHAPALVCCTVYFDDSRMFDLLRWMRAERAHIPVICARAVPKDITKVSMEAVKIAVNALGARSFIDVALLAEKHGMEAARAALRLLLLDHLSGARM
jgi:DNA-binding NarL/FixJ family response regulator